MKAPDWLSHLRTDSRGRPVPVINRWGLTEKQEPWLDQRCAEFAMKYCPALIRRADADDLTLISITSKRDCDILIGTGYSDGFPETRTKPVAQWASILIKSPVVIG